MNTNRIALALLRHARKVMPQQQAAWGAAMEREAQEIAGGHETLTWALGCLAASYGERLRAEHYLLPLLARCYLACICIAYAIGHLMSPPYPQLLCALFGQARPVYPPFPFTIPLASVFYPQHYSIQAGCYFMRAIPIPISIVTLVRTGLLLLTVWWLIRGRAAALITFILASLIGASGILWTLTLAGYQATIAGQSVLGPAAHHYVLPGGQTSVRELLLNILFAIVYPLIIGTGIALLVRKDDVPASKN